MSTDKELLKLAAKAAGKHANEWADVGELLPHKGGWVQYVGKGQVEIFNSLTDGADALWLAVQLRFGFKEFAPRETDAIVQAPPDNRLYGTVEVWREDDDDPVYVHWYRVGDDRHIATRYALTRAAAEIGRQQL